MIIVKCDKCSEVLHQPGALVFSPPTSENDVKKYHICKECWEKLKDWITYEKEFWK